MTEFAPRNKTDFFSEAFLVLTNIKSATGDYQEKKVFWEQGPAYRCAKSALPNESRVYRCKMIDTAAWMPK